MARPNVHIEGLDEFRRAIRKCQDETVDEALKAIHLELADEVVRRAMSDVPVKTGRLKATLKARGTVRDMIGRAGGIKSVPYAPPVHWGNSKLGIESRPFLTDAAKALEADITDRYDEVMADMLDRVIGRT